MISLIFNSFNFINNFHILQSIILNFLFKFDELWNFIRTMNLGTIFKFDSISITLIPKCNNNTLFPSLWTCSNFTFYFISDWVGKLWGNAIFKTVDQIVSIDILANKAEISLSWFIFWPAILNKVTSKEHMDTLENVWTVHSNNINNTFVSVKIVGLCWDQIWNPGLQFSETDWFIKTTTTWADWLIMDMFLINI